MHSRVRQFLLALLFLAPLAALQAAGPTQPNFVFILGEGHGWSSTSVQMDDSEPASKSRFVRTPNLEKLAAGGMRFASFYAHFPRCTPSRASLLNGKSPAQLHMTFSGEGKQDTGASANGRRDLVLENVVLRHQLLVLNRHVKQSRLTLLDRALWVCLSRGWRAWKTPLRLVQPDAKGPDVRLRTVGSGQQA